MAEHIKTTDPVTDEGNRHLLQCEQCQRDFSAAYWLAKNDPTYWRLVDHWGDLRGA